jgi:hypothetical protein
VMFLAAPTRPVQGTVFAVHSRVAFVALSPIFAVKMISGVTTVRAGLKSKAPAPPAERQHQTTSSAAQTSSRLVLASRNGSYTVQHLMVAAMATTRNVWIVDVRAKTVVTSQLPAHELPKLHFCPMDAPGPMINFCSDTPQTLRLAHLSADRESAFKFATLALGRHALL